MSFMKNLQLAVVFLLFFNGCSKDLPLEKDGSLTLEVIVADKSELIDVDNTLGYAPVPDATVTLTSRKYYTGDQIAVTYTAITDEQGVATFTNIDAGPYTVFVEGKTVAVDSLSGFEKEVTLSGGVLAEVYKLLTLADTVKTIASVASDLVINEIYYTGPPNRAHYFFDQFIELYNASLHTVYLDGLIICRARPYHHPEMETMNFLQAIYVYQFPGSPGGQEYPLESHAFSVIATDAINHGAYIENAVDLSNADWEFYNPYKGDYDSPAPDVIEAIPGRSTDFYISLTHNAVILAEGDGWYFGEFSDSGYQYAHIPLDKVLDVVEYSTNPEKLKEITTRMDAGFAGIGIAKYDGRSTERRILGSDTNNSTLDFIVNETPTPGYQHE